MHSEVFGAECPACSPCTALHDCRCFWHLSQNISKKLKRTMGADAFQELLQHFKAAVFATSEASMRAKWELVEQVGARLKLRVKRDSCCSHVMCSLLFAAVHGGK